MKKHYKSFGVIAVLGFLTAWLGVPTFNKWRADRLVDELCAKDAGVKVYETVMLQKQKFNQWGQFNVPDEKYRKSEDEYYRVGKVMNIKGKNESSDIQALTVYQIRFWIYRAADKKLLGESIGYARRGGDSFGPWHPSAHSCPDFGVDIELSRKIFSTIK